MFACVCRAVRVEEVASAIADGADTVERIGEMTGAGTGCGCCHDRLRDMIAEAQGRELLPVLRSA